MSRINGHDLVEMLAGQRLHNLKSLTLTHPRISNARPSGNSQVPRVRQFRASEFVHPQWNQSLSGIISNLCGGTF